MSPTSYQTAPPRIYSILCYFLRASGVGSTSGRLTFGLFTGWEPDKLPDCSTPHLFDTLLLFTSLWCGLNLRSFDLRTFYRLGARQTTRLLHPASIRYFVTFYEPLVWAQPQVAGPSDFLQVGSPTNYQTALPCNNSLRSSFTSPLEGAKPCKGLLLYSNEGRAL